ncbi:4-hydroxy-tetrahydrodipicolinate reductase [bacterium]|nr:4-hydroxy-tetrahydrodipicolinate reductase [bacterium]
MGQAVEAYIAGIFDLTISARLEQGDDLPEFLTARPDVIVDFSLAAAVATNGPKIAAAGIPYIIGASGLQRDTLNELERIATETDSPVLLVPNFSLGANLLIKFAAAAARYMDFPVITERHHDLKQDAPSGTAIYTAERINQARSPSERTSTTPTFGEQVPGVLGGSQAGVAIHSVRGSGYLAEQQVMFSLGGESLIMEHRSIDRRCFMPGVEYAIRNISKVSGLVIGLDTILEL